MPYKNRQDALENKRLKARAATIVKLKAIGCDPVDPTDPYTRAICWTCGKETGFSCAPQWRHEKSCPHYIPGNAKRHQQTRCFNRRHDFGPDGYCRWPNCRTRINDPLIQRLNNVATIARRRRMSNNAPHDPNQHNPDLLDMEDGLEARHATVAWCLQHLTLAHDNLPALAVNDQIKNRMARSMAALTGEEARLRGQLMRVRMPDE